MSMSEIRYQLIQDAEHLGDVQAVPWKSKTIFKTLVKTMVVR